MITLLSLLTPEETKIAMKSRVIDLLTKDFDTLTIGDLIHINSTPIFYYPSTDMLFAELYNRYGNLIREIKDGKTEIK